MALFYQISNFAGAERAVIDAQLIQLTVEMPTSQLVPSKLQRIGVGDGSSGEGCSPGFDTVDEDTLIAWRVADQDVAPLTDS
ncbi:MAG: hypothetical protein MK363_15565 [Pseudomonas sp.]|nr:hypothetical protein [Pseudomonas sp.]